MLVALLVALLLIIGTMALVVLMSLGVVGFYWAKAKVEAWING